MDGAKPIMILPAATKQMISKGLFDSGSDKSDTSHKENSENEDETTDDSGQCYRKPEENMEKFTASCDRKQYIWESGMLSFT